MPRLLTVEEAAAELGVPKGSLETAARTHGFLVCMGKARRIDPKTLPELIEKCRENPKEQGSTSAATASLPSATEPSSSQQALEIAERLRQPSPGTSPNGTGRPVVQLRRRK